MTPARRWLLTGVTNGRGRRSYISQDSSTSTITLNKSILYLSSQAKQSQAGNGRRSQRARVAGKVSFGNCSTDAPRSTALTRGGSGKPLLATGIGFARRGSGGRWTDDSETDAGSPSVAVTHHIHSDSLPYTLISPLPLFSPSLSLSLLSPFPLSLPSPLPLFPLSLSLSFPSPLPLSLPFLLSLIYSLSLSPSPPLCILLRLPPHPLPFPHIHYFLSLSLFLLHISLFLSNFPLSLPIFFSASPFPPFFIYFLLSLFPHPLPFHFSLSLFLLPHFPIHSSFSLSIFLSPHFLSLIHYPSFFHILFPFPFLHLFPPPSFYPYPFSSLPHTLPFFPIHFPVSLFPPPFIPPFPYPLSSLLPPTFYPLRPSSSLQIPYILDPYDLLL
ncbi:hypothetical protein C7M84_011676 [Penaeus vannamei]|uniref:Uncharacterized protein n=1 Tax=Penaeus vannamei TaxID=6689 RepID=A0A423T0Z6_PENVA|nr:hypothetical protein C7M84_011676 [Penaeus vannamei]